MPVLIMVQAGAVDFEWRKQVVGIRTNHFEMWDMRSHLHFVGSSVDTGY